MITAIKHLKLQGNADAAGFTILNLDLTGLGLTKSSVGLGNVDNTSDANKPVSTAQAIAIALKEPLIAAGTSGQFWNGDKEWIDYGALALENGSTSLPYLAAIGAGATSSAKIEARRNDAGSSSVGTSIQQHGASEVGSILGLSAANMGVLDFFGTAFGVIKTNTTAPLLFGYNNIRRMRLMTGLNVGGDTDPGAGCIKAAGTIFGVDLTLTGDITADDITAQDMALTGNGTVAGSLTVTSVLTTNSNLLAVGNLVIGGVIVNFANLPTSDPHVAGQLWRSTNDVKISTG